MGGVSLGVRRGGMGEYQTHRTSSRSSPGRSLRCRDRVPKGAGTGREWTGGGGKGGVRGEGRGVEAQAGHSEARGCGSRTGLQGRSVLVLRLYMFCWASRRVVAKVWRTATCPRGEGRRTADGSRLHPSRQAARQPASQSAGLVGGTERAENSVTQRPSADSLWRAGEGAGGGSGRRGGLTHLATDDGRHGQLDSHRAIAGAEGQRPRGTGQAFRRVGAVQEEQTAGQ
ncbi:hypothetical protein P280DRAFT_48242 [Massarina eburnea CBS 473.64]|uniref:Uncharacterized protein n=1 Tax=Massarina eburnea CBS 473.64 TaxID=1395130 RepID=A0A6A6S001_9PLEO|nr:hypothetical protein P280DRAFT_48242 [Massarina eburnea CBS 473.64]